MKELTIQESKNLTGLARRIRDTYAAAEDAKQHAWSKCNEAVAEVLLCGQALSQAKKIVGYGRWLDWLKENCPGVCEKTAQNYMRLSKTQHVADLDGRSLRQAYIEAGIIPEPKPKPKEQTCQGSDNDSSRSIESPKPESPSPSPNPSPSQPCGITCSPSIQTTDSSPSPSVESNCPDTSEEQCSQEDLPSSGATIAISSDLSPLERLKSLVQSLMDEISSSEWKVDETEIKALLEPIIQWLRCRGENV